MQLAMPLVSASNFVIHRSMVNCEIRSVKIYRASFNIPSFPNRSSLPYRWIDLVVTRFSGLEHYTSGSPRCSLGSTHFLVRLLPSCLT